MQGVNYQRLNYPVIIFPRVVGILPGTEGKLPYVNLPSTEGILPSVEGKLIEGNLPSVEGKIPPTGVS